MAPSLLLAEDEPLIAMSLADFFEAAGFEVTLASNGIDALEQAANLTAQGRVLDALVTDLDMPEMGGEDLIRAMRANRPELPVLVVTGSPPPGGAEALQQYGGGFGPLTLLHKPVGYAVLLDALQHAINAKVRGSSGYATA